MAVGLAYKSSSNFSQTQSASGTFVMLSEAKTSELESESSTCFPCKKSPQVPGGGGGGGTLGISGWGCAAGTREPLTYTRASSAKFCYPILE